MNKLIRFFKRKKVTVVLLGGLGNQLFQIAAVLHYANKYNFKAVFHFDEVIKSPYGGGEEWPSYWHIFNTTKILSLEDITKDKYTKISQKKFSYTPFVKLSKNVQLEGYYQAVKYVDYVREQMIKLMWSNRELTKYVDSLYDDIVNRLGTSELISVHIRRGDYLGISNHHTNLTLDYYLEAISRFPDKTPLIVFSNDQIWCKENLEKLIHNPLIFISEKDYVEILLMSKIKNNIIANSSFSWWSTYINEHEGKKTIAPKNWFGIDWKGPGGEKKWSDVYSQEWELI